MWLDVIIIIGLLCLFVVFYKTWQYLDKNLKEIYQKFDTIYFMLCDIFKIRHDRSKKGKK